MTKKNILYWLESKREEEKRVADCKYDVAPSDNIQKMEPVSRTLYRDEIRIIDRKYNKLISSVNRKKDDDEVCEYLNGKGFDVSGIS